MTRRHTASTITDPALDELYARLDELAAFRDVVLLEAEHWDDNSLATIRANLNATKETAA